MRQIKVPEHRNQQVVKELYSRWDERIERPGKRDIRTFGRFVDEREGMFGCYAVFVVNDVIYIDSELYGKFSSVSDAELVCQILEVQGIDNSDYTATLLEYAAAYAI